MRNTTGVDREKMREVVGKRIVWAPKAPKIALIGCLSAVLACGAWQVGAQTPTVHEWTVATPHTPAVPWVSVLRDFFIPEFKRRAARRPGFQVDFYPAWGGSLVRWGDGLEAVEIGLADLGFVGTLWESSKLPLQNVTYSLPFITDDLGALLNSVNALHREVPALEATWREYKQVFLGAAGVDTYHLFTNFPIRTLDDLKGRKILAPGVSALWLRGTGAVAVDGALSTYYTQLRTGVADGAVSIATGIYPYGIHEVAPYLTLVGIGAQWVGALTINENVWDNLPGEIQLELKTLGEAYTRKVAEIVEQRRSKAVAAMIDEGVEVSVLPAAEKRRWIDGLPQLGREWVTRNEARQLPARELLDVLMRKLKEQGALISTDWTQTLEAR
ncbi:MAG: C4-dicarboxylate TRAP transporter substrate-binding protein [Pseudomonadota bacterium]